MPNKVRIGLLTTKNNLFLNFYIKELLRIRHKEFYIIYDTKNLNKRILKVLEKRTNNFFKNKIEFDKKEVKFLKNQSFTSNHNGKKVVNFIKKKEINLLFNAGTPRKLNFSTLNSTKYGVLNIHPGILPKYRGSMCVEWSLLNNDPVGNSAHFMDEDYDSGYLLYKKITNISNISNYQKIRNKVYLESFYIFSKIVKKIKKNNIKPVKLNNSKFPVFKPMKNEVFLKMLKKINSK